MRNKIDQALKVVVGCSTPTLGLLFEFGGGIMLCNSVCGLLLLISNKGEESESSWKNRCLRCFNDTEEDCTSGVSAVNGSYERCLRGGSGSRKGSYERWGS